MLSVGRTLPCAGQRPRCAAAPGARTSRGESMRSMDLDRKRRSLGAKARITDAKPQHARVRSWVLVHTLSARYPLRLPGVRATLSRLLLRANLRQTGRDGGDHWQDTQSLGDGGRAKPTSTTIANNPRGVVVVTTPLHARHVLPGASAAPVNQLLLRPELPGRRWMGG